MHRTVIYYHRLQFPSESGQTIQVLRDYHALASLAYSVHLIYRDAGVPRVFDESAALQAYGLEPLPTFHLHPLFEGGFSKRRMRELVRQIIRDTPGDTVFLVTRTLDHARAALALRKNVRQLPLKVVLELHETAIPHMIYSEQGRPLRALLSSFIEKRVFCMLDGIICTVGSQQVLLDNLYPAHAPVAVLPNGVQTHVLDAVPIQRDGDGRAFRLGYAGQFNAWKNVDVIIEALKFLPENVVLTIAGGRTDGEQVVREKLMSLAARVGVLGRVEYVGFLQPRQVPEFLASMDTLLLPLGDNAQSRYFTSPMKLFEYAASGVPMVVTRQPTTVSLIQDGVHGLMCEPGSPQSMAKQIAKLLADFGLGCKLASQARTWVAQHAYDTRAARLDVFLGSLMVAEPH
jgi:glycosyltransferase involved in cell wall biosynthesis